MDDTKDFYGKDYWFGYQEDLGFTDIRERARHDLSHRCLHWLRTALRYQLTPATSLELGCAHGGFVGMLRSVGFDAHGLELSPSIAAFAARSFGVPVLIGPVEDQSISPNSLDLVLAMDVLEHFPYPLETVRHCASLLTRSGKFIFQTPCYPEGMSFEAMQVHQAAFLEMLRPQEHIYLFSRTSIRALFERVECRHLAFEPAMFAAYDMFVVASPTPLEARSEDETIASLTGTGTTEPRLVLGLLDLNREGADLAARLTQAEGDAAARLQNMMTLEALLAEANTDRAARFTQIQELGRLLQEANTDQAARLEQVQTLDALLKEANADRAARLEQTQVLEAMLHEASAERAAADNRHFATEQQFEQLLETTRDALAATRAELELRRTTSTAPPKPARLRIGFRRQRKLKEQPLVAVDVTPILPGSENGGAKGFVLALLEGFAQRGRHRYVLLTTPTNHDNFAAFERPGMTRLCLVGGAVPHVSRHGVRERFRHGQQNGIGRGALVERGVELLFCPMTDPALAEPGLPVVCTVYDLQHLEYPSFFTAAERANRDAFLSRVKGAANLVVGISEFTRGEVIERLGLTTERVRAIPIAIHSRLVPPSAALVADTRARLGIGDAPYAFYPANGWPHKNHRLLLVGFARLIAERPELPLHLVLAGNLLELGPELQMAVEQMGLAERVHFLGFVSDEDLAALWRGAFCLLFPSLYEGFGIPLLEAMQFGVPIVCSELSSLAALAGVAARYIDPRRPADIGAALQELFDRPALRLALIERGGRRLKAFRASEMVDRYLDVIDEVLSGGGHAPEAWIDGLFGDRWLGPVLRAHAPASARGRVWDFEVHLPEWHPHPAATVRAELNGRKVMRLRLVRGQTSCIRINVPPAGGHVRLETAPSFVPGANGDHRELTVLLTRCQLKESATGAIVHEA